jgi:branched-chain amino acid transport system permease protein
MAVALILILETAMEVTLGGVTRSIPPFVPGIVQVGFVSIDAQRLTVLIVGGVLLLAMFLFIQKSKLGQQMLAVAQNRTGAALQGIDINFTAAAASCLASAMAALAGSMMASLFSLSPFMGDSILLKAIQVVILSGIGSVGGILAGGLIIGCMDAVLPVFMDDNIAQLIIIGVVILILLVRPKGLFGCDLF